MQNIPMINTMVFIATKIAVIVALQLTGFINL